MVISRWSRCWLILLTGVSLVLRAGAAGALETVEEWLSYDWGKLLIKPQLGLSAKFTDNVFYGNDSVYTKFYLNEIQPYNVTLPGLGTVSFPGRTNVQTAPGGVTLSTNFFVNSQGFVTNFNYTVRIPAYVETVNGISTAIPQRDVVSTVPGAASVTSVVVPLRPVESELFLIASPGMRVQYGDTGLNTVTFGYNYDEIKYVNNPRFSTAQHRGTVNADLKLGRFTIAGTDSIQLLSSFMGGNTSGLSNQVDRMVWSDNYRVTYDATAKTDFYVSVGHSRYDYDQGVSIYDSESVKGAFGASYVWSPRVRAFAELEYGRSFVSPNLATQADAPDSTVYGGFFGVRGEFTPRIQGSLKVGYESRVFQGTFTPGNEPASIASPAVTADLSYTLSAKTFLKLAYTRSTDVSPQFAKQSYIYDRVQVTANQLIGTTGKWLVSANLGVNLGDFSETPGVNQARTDRILEGGLRLSYQPRPWLITVLGYEYENYSTNFKDPSVARRATLIDYQVNSITLSVNIGY